MITEQTQTRRIRSRKEILKSINESHKGAEALCILANSFSLTEGEYRKLADEEWCGKIALEELREDGTRAVDIILEVLYKWNEKRPEKMFDLTKELPFELHHGIKNLIELSMEFATPQHAEKIAGMLFWDEILTKKSSLIVCRQIVKTLTRIGNASIVPLLQQYKIFLNCRTLEDHPITDIQEAKQEVERAIITCQQRQTK